MTSRPERAETDEALDPRVERSRAAILGAAAEEFLRKGYLGAGVDDIADRARVSKRTIYNVFGGKDRLFREVMSDAVATAERFSHDLSSRLGTSDDVAAELREIGTRLAATVLTGPVVRLRRLLIAEAENFPELAADYYRRAPGQVIETLSAVFRRCHDRGLLFIEDPDLAAEHFAFLVMGAALDRALFETSTPPAADVERRALAGVETFLRAYRVPRPSPSVS